MAFELYRRSYPVEIPLGAAVLLWRPGESFPELGKILFVLEDTFGPSSEKYDNYKQSFSFPCFLEVKIGDEVIHLVLNIWDFKGAIDFRFRRMIERDEDLSKKTDVIACCTEISEADFEYIVGFLVGWIEGYVNTRCEYSRPKEPFYRTVQAALTVYGYYENDFFYKHYEDHAAFEAEVAELRKRIPAQSALTLDSNQRIADAKKWIEKAKQESISF
jgi:hypothetical protein